MSQEDLLKNITACFSGCLQPAPEDLLKEDAKDFLEAEIMRGEFQGFTWESLTTSILVRHKSGLGFLSYQAFVYYLPSYMKLIVLDIDSADVITDQLLDMLTLPSEMDATIEYMNYKKGGLTISGLDQFLENKIATTHERIHQFMQWTSTLTVEHSACVLHFLQYLKINYPLYFEEQVLENAIDRYWFKFDLQS